MIDIFSMRSIQKRFIHSVALFCYLSFVHGAFLSSSYFGGGESNSVKYRLSSLRQLNAYIDGADGLVSSGPRNFFTSNNNNDIHTNFYTRIPPKQLANGGKVTLVGSGPVRDLILSSW